MSDFNLNTSIQNWKKSLQQHPQLEPGDIEELENHLLEAIDVNIESGLNEELAFQKAVQNIEKGFSEALTEYTFSSSSHEPSSKWLSSWWIPELLPNILKVTVRNFKRQPGYSFINITGLAIGIACCLIIYLFVTDELSYDNFHEKADRIYRIDQTNMWANFDGRFSSTGPGISGILKSEIPEIETVLRINNPSDWLVTITDNSTEPTYFEEPRVLAADSTFFDIFTMEFLEGNASKSLTSPYSLVITEKTRQRYFDTDLALGKTIRVGNPGEEIDYQVTGVVKEMPANSHITFDLLTSLSSNPTVKRREDTWIWTVFVTYIVLNENASINYVRNKLPNVLANHTEAKLYNAFGMSTEQFQKSGKKWEMYLTPITDIHLKSKGAGNRLGTVSDIFYVYVFITIALMIIALASINFMNLSSARSVYRAKEVGIRKTLGSENAALIGQFLSESILFSFISLFLALIITVLLIDPFNQIASEDLSVTALWTPLTVLGILCFTVFIGFLAGIYPALYLTSFNPIQAFKSKLPAISQNRLSFSGLRNFLVVFQFAISIMLISCSIIIYQQLNYVQNKNLGFDKENVLILENVEKLGSRTDSFKQLIKSEPGVNQVAKSNAVPPNIWYEDFATVYGSDGAEIPLNSMVVDDDLVTTMGFQIVNGTGFHKGSGANSHYVVLNETAVEQLPWSDEASKNENFPLGESILFSGNGVNYEVIGVVKDFNIASLHSGILPLAFFHESSEVWAGPNRFLSIRFERNTDISQLISNIEKHWTSFAGNLPFDYTFLDNQLKEQYKAEQQVAKVVSIFTGLAIFIAILGLLGLITFSIEKRTKEIGIRKVMGASSGKIVILLSKEMFRLIVISIIIACPIAWSLMSKWLQNFEYRIEISFYVFIISGLAALTLAWTILSFKTIKAALMNPIHSLRSE